MLRTPGRQWAGKNHQSGRLPAPLWIKLSYTTLVIVVIPVYWRDLGATNLLWFSDIALMVLAVALWFGSRLLASMMAVGTLFAELLWVADFLTGGHARLAGYMYDPDTELHIRILSGMFHLVLPPVMLFLLIRWGYDQRALAAQTALALLVLPVTYLSSDPTDNINWVYGPGGEQTLLPPLVYLGLLMVALPLLVYLPSHLILRRLFGQAPCPPGQ